MPSRTRSYAPCPSEKGGIEVIASRQLKEIARKGKIHSLAIFANFNIPLNPWRKAHESETPNSVISQEQQIVRRVINLIE